MSFFCYKLAQKFRSGGTIKFPLDGDVVDTPVYKMTVFLAPEPTKVI